MFRNGRNCKEMVEFGKKRNGKNRNGQEMKEILLKDSVQMVYERTLTLHIWTQTFIFIGIDGASNRRRFRALNKGSALYATLGELIQYLEV